MGHEQFFVIPWHRWPHCCYIWSIGNKNEENFVIIFDLVFFFLRCTQITVEIRSKIVAGAEKECPKLYGCECDTNLCILWSCFPRFHAALTVCRKWYHLLQSVTSNASAGVQLWSIRAALCRTGRRALRPVLPISRRAAVTSSEHQRINWTILQFVSSLWHLVLFCSQQ